MKGYLKEEKELTMRLQRPRGRNRLGRCEDEADIPGRRWDGRLVARPR